jgi:uncharacterized protein YbjQ (UPF0145 family)
MIVTTTENIPNARVAKTLGQVFGLTVRSRSLGGNIAALLKGLVGGEIGSYGTARVIEWTDAPDTAPGQG